MCGSKIQQKRPPIGSTNIYDLELYTKPRKKRLIFLKVKKSKIYTDRVPIRWSPTTKEEINVKFKTEEADRGSPWSKIKKWRDRDHLQIVEGRLAAEAERSRATEISASPLLPLPRGEERGWKQNKSTSRLVRLTAKSCFATWGRGRMTGDRL